MPRKIRFGRVCLPRAVVGPDSLWLDLEGEERCLAKIPETTSIDQCNVNVAWEYTEDEMVLGSMSVRVLVFASRKIEIVQEVWRMGFGEEVGIAQFLLLISGQVFSY